jgi:hypothetical protein
MVHKDYEDTILVDLKVLLGKVLGHLQLDCHLRFMETVMII